MSMRLKIELMVMMFIQFFIWGVWYVPMGAYLGEAGMSSVTGYAYSTTAWAAIISPFFVGMIADRFFSAQHVLGVMHLMGAVLMYIASGITQPAMFLAVLLGYTICYMSTLGLVNAIAFGQMDNIEKQFPPIRVMGTLGWIVTGWVVSAGAWEQTAMPMKIAAAASLVLGIYSFFLPNTPPASKGKKVSVGDILGLDALSLMKDRSFAVFIICSFLICIPLAFYYTWGAQFLIENEITGVAAKLTLGQISEMFFMVLMAFFLARLGVKKMLIIGMLAWLARYLLFAYAGGSSAMMVMIYIGILLHGICYDFFFVTGQIYVDKKAPVAIRANAQGLIALVTYGAGMAIGSIVAGRVANANIGADELHIWKPIWMFPAVMALVVIILFAVTFKENNTSAEEVEGDVDEAPADAAEAATE